MTTNYPGAIDSLSNPTSSDPLSSPSHSQQHQNANDAIEAIETALGTAPAGTAVNVSARIASMEAYIPTIGTAVTEAQLAAAQSATSSSASTASATAASASAAQASSLYADFDKRYLGPKATAPTVDNEGNALVPGALYWNTAVPAMYVWTGSAWTLAVNSVYAWSGPVTIVDNSSNTALRVTQTGAGNALLVEDSANPDSTPFVIDASGKVLIGQTSSADTAVLQVANDTSVGYLGVSAGSSGSPINLRRVNGTVASPTTVAQSDVLGVIRFQGFDGTTNITAADILSTVGGVPGTSDMPGTLVFRTTADGAAAVTERMRITAGGNVGIGTANPGYKLDVNGTANFSGVTTAPTAASGTSTTQVATTEFVTTADALKADVISETTTDYTLSSNVLTFNLSNGNVGYIATAPTAAMTFNFTNAPTTNGKSISVSVFVTQGATGYIPTTVQIAGTGQTIKWAGGSAPTATNGAGKIDVFSFTLIRRSSAWTVLGSALANF